ncbi:hypothetical protein SAY86_026868 [Trapa natans]|uniref:Thaumatin-like protein 1b n=1 Tax=Trapa natans TaxID=22666 RepID=A0AAN7KBI4_TRANT|nr:hypothetical protein SAY86_026868 [Trapa natans]
MITDGMFLIAYIFKIFPKHHQAADSNQHHMGLFFSLHHGSSSSSILLLGLGCTLLLFITSCKGATFRLVNKCDFTVWPGILSSAGSPNLGSTGFELRKGGSRSFQTPTGWSGRFWGRSGCEFDSSGRGSCATGDCGSGEVECNGAGATPPATLAEFTLGASGSQDFYDVSLVDGYNLPIIVQGTGGSGSCETTGCVKDLNQQCPEELRTGVGTGCKSACEAFGSPEYCCSGAYNNPSTCRPSLYSQIFKAACPKSYSYAYDDATSTFTCSGADYTVMFCPDSPSLKSYTDSSPLNRSGATDDSSSSGTESNTGSSPVPVQDTAFAMSWLANLATGSSTRLSRLPLAAQLAISQFVTMLMGKTQGQGIHARYRGVLSIVASMGQLICSGPWKAVMAIFATSSTSHVTDSFSMMKRIRRPRRMDKGHGHWRSPEGASPAAASDSWRESVTGSRFNSWP